MKETPEQWLRRIEIADVRRMMNVREGRRFMWRLLGLSRVFEIPAAGESGPVNFANGQRVIGTTMLMEIMQACPEQWATMQQEAVQDQQTLAALRQQEQQEQDNDRRSDTSGE